MCALRSDEATEADGGRGWRSPSASTGSRSSWILFLLRGECLEARLTTDTALAG